MAEARHRAELGSMAAYAGFAALVSALCGLYLELAREVFAAERTGVRTGILYGSPTLASTLGFFAFVMPLFAGLLLLTRARRVPAWLLRHRWPIACALIALLTLLQISGSSLALWGPALGENAFQGTLWGIPRAIRTDEWVVFTPFSFSQVTTGSQAVSDVIRGGATDVTMVYAQPAWSIATAFRPFLWGYLFLGASHGLAFFWCARAVLLVLVSFDCLSMVSGGRHRLAAWGAVLVGFSPIVEWWFAVNGTVELFVFGQGLVLALHHLLRTRTRAGRWGWSALLAWLLGCYALIVYPAWQIPLAYAFGALGAWDLWEWVRKRRAPHGMMDSTSRRNPCRPEEEKDARTNIGSLATPLLASLTVAGIFLGISLTNAWEALAAEAATVYPGTTVRTGGGLAAWLANGATSLLAPLLPESFDPNVCEASAFFSLFPAGVIGAIVLVIWDLARRLPNSQTSHAPLPAIRIARQPEIRPAGRRTETHDQGRSTRGPDACLVALLVAYGLLASYGMFGLPPVLARLTLLDHVQTGRLPMALGYLDVVLLVRTVAVAQSHEARAHVNRQSGLATGMLAGTHPAPLALVKDERHTIAVSAILVCLGAAGLVVAARMRLPELMDAPRCAFMALVFAACLAPFVLPRSVFGESAPANEPRDSVSLRAHAPSRETWLLATASFVFAAGMCVNPIQLGADALLASPTLDEVRSVAQGDPDALWLTDDALLGQACITCGARTITSANVYPNLQRWRTLDPDGSFEDVYNRYAHISVELGETTSFQVLAPDAFRAIVAPDDVPKLGATYWLSRANLAAWNTEHVRFEPLRQLGELTLYRIDAL